MTRAVQRSRRIRAARWYTFAGATLSLVFTAGQAEAFCRTTTCDPKKELCPVDEAGCKVTGQPLYWPDLCVNFSVHAQGSVVRGISAEQTRRALERAFQTWISVDCGDGRHPSLGAVSRGEVFCSEVEFNQDGTDEDGQRRVDGPNANVVMFRDESWPHEDAKTLGMTNVTFVPSTGEILDADIELNAFDTQFTTSNDFVLVDLQSVLTHEVGHFLGLAHSAVKGSTMNADYDAGDLDFRSLSEDDRDAICAAYPPLDIAIDTQAEQDGASQVIDCRGADPRYGYSKYCGEVALADGCAVSAQGGTNPAGTLKSLALLSLLLVARRKKGLGTFRMRDCPRRGVTTAGKPPN